MENIRWFENEAEVARLVIILQTADKWKEGKGHIKKQLEKGSKTMH